LFALWGDNVCMEFVAYYYSFLLTVMLTCMYLYLYA